MNSLILVFRWSMVLLVAGWSGCARMGPYRTVGSATVPGQQGPGIEPGPDFTLGFVELDAVGWFWDATGQQLTAIENTILEQAQRADPPSRGVVIIAFVHGWKHNAREGDENVASFKRLLARVARDERTETNRDNPRPVVGVYIGWPGLRADIEPFRELSFYSRKNTADRVGYRGGVTEVLCRLENVHRHINQRQNLPLNDSHRSFFVVVGHSFGAQVVYDAIAPILTKQLIDAGFAVPAGGPASAAARREIRVTPFGDMVLLVNPAFEASRYYNLRELSRRFGYLPEQYPAFAVFSSEADRATQRAFPLGRLLARPFLTYRDDELSRRQVESDHHTVGWMDELVTHTLQPAEVGEAVMDIENQDFHWTAASRAQPLKMSGAVLRPVDRAPANWTPFYVVRVSDKIIKDHGAFWESSFPDFVSWFIALPLREAPRTGGQVAATKPQP